MLKNILEATFDQIFQSNKNPHVEYSPSKSPKVHFLWLLVSKFDLLVAYTPLNFLPTRFKKILPPTRFKNLWTRKKKAANSSVNIPIAARRCARRNRNGVKSCLDVSERFFFSTQSFISKILVPMCPARRCLLLCN
jgi:hypothetical protein